MNKNFYGRHQLTSDVFVIEFFLPPLFLFSFPLFKTLNSEFWWQQPKTQSPLHPLNFTLLSQKKKKDRRTFLNHTKKEVYKRKKKVAKQLFKQVIINLKTKKNKQVRKYFLNINLCRRKKFRLFCCTDLFNVQKRKKKYI